MAANIKDLQRLEVDDIDQEIYYQEMIGCTVNQEPGGRCATVHCSTGDSYICQNPNVKLDEATDVGCGDPECDAC